MAPCSDLEEHLLAEVQLEAKRADTDVVANSEIVTKNHAIFVLLHSHHAIFVLLHSARVIERKHRQCICCGVD